jgi:Bacterial Ig-like domain (group 3)/FG-GAP-like repeat
MTLQSSKNFACGILFLVMGFAFASGQSSSSSVPAPFVPPSVVNGKTLGRAAHGRAQAAADEKKRTPMTPFDRAIRPGLKRILAKSNETAAQRGALRGLSVTHSSSAASSLNFGGFVAAPKYIAYDTADQDTSPLSAFANGDFNHDGLPDIVTIQASGAVNVVLNQGGTFGNVITTLTNSNNVGGVIQVLAMDVDKDGYDDLLILDGSNNAVAVMIGNHDGSFAAPQSFGFSDYVASSIASADLNGDGFPDLVVLGSNVTFDQNFNPTTLVEMDTYLNDGHGGFIAPTGPRKQKLTYSGYYQTLIGRSIVLADVNNDGLLDATVEDIHFLTTDSPDEEHMILTFLGQGSGVFAHVVKENNIVIPAESTFNIGYPLIANLNVVDVNNDGNKDVVFSYQDYNIYEVLGNGDGTYQFYTNVGAYQAYPTDMTVADINGSGIPDIIDAEPDYLAIYPNRGDGTFDTTTIRNYGSGMGQWSVLSGADFSGDGINDVALMNSIEGTVTMFNGVSGANAVYGAQLLDPGQGYVSRVQAQSVVDANNDGFDDVLVYNQGRAQDKPSLLTAIGNGKGSFLYANAMPGFDASSFDFIEAKKGDFNGDGLDDLVMHTYDGVYILLSNGDGTFRSSKVSLGSGFDCLTHHAAIGDVNGDGFLDLVVAYEGDRIYGCNSGTTSSGYFTVLGKGDGTFQPATFTALGDELFEPVLADLNGDGSLDLVASDVVFDALGEGYPATFKTFQLIGKGDGTFQAPTILANNYINAGTLVGDVNDDGKPDLVLLMEGSTDDSGQTLFLDTAGPLPLLNNGDATFTTGTQFASGFFSAGGLLTDLNGDGELDLLLSEFVSYNFTDNVAGGIAALGNGTGTFAATGNFEVGDASSTILRGDFLKDSAPDALFVSGGSGTTLVIARGGTKVSAQTDTPTISAGDPVTIDVTVTATLAGRPQPTGTVTLMENGASLGSSDLNAGGTSIVVNGLAVGSHQLVAEYSGDGNFNVNGASSVVVQVVAAPGIAISANPGSLTLTQGQTGVIALSATANASYTGNVTFSVSGAPAGMTVSLNPSTVALTPNQSANTTLIVGVGTTMASASAAWPSFTSLTGGGLGLAGIVLLAIPRRRRKMVQSFAMATLLLGVLIGTMTMTACGGSSSSGSGPKGPTTLTITATPSVPQAPMQTMTVTINVQ